MISDVKSKNVGSFKLSGKGEIRISCPDSLSCGARFLSDLLSVLYEIKTEYNNDADIRFINDENLLEEAYRLCVDEDGVDIYASSIRGAVYAVATLVQNIEGKHCDLISFMELDDKPQKSVRGLHLYLPSRENIVAFKRIIDVAAFFKMNTVILEIGGGMQLDKHPEINEAWTKFANMSKNVFPGVDGARSVQRTSFYWKDSIHPELAGASYLAKREVADLVAHIRSRGMEVVPEIQALSHSYYLTIPHREIAEFPDDPFPDSYCPLNEKSYELYFEVAEEIIDVIKPSLVSVGHDEIRILGQCEKCSEHSGEELIAYELNRLHTFYKSHGIRITMWADSVQRFVNYLGSFSGGVGDEHITGWGYHYRLPESYKAIDNIPNDILMIDWFHSMGRGSQDCFAERGFEVIYGNFDGSLFGEWDERSQNSAVLGAEVSSWCVTDEFAFALNGIFHKMAFSASILWSDSYNNSKYTEVNEEFIRISPIVRAIMRGESMPSFTSSRASLVYTSSMEGSSSAIKLRGAHLMDKSAEDVISLFGDTAYGAPINTTDVNLKPDIYAKSLVFLHNATEEMKFIPTFHYLDRNVQALGAYAVVYEDGDFELVNLYYGNGIGVNNLKMSRKRKADGETVEEIDVSMAAAAGKKQIACYFDHTNSYFGSIAYTALPIITEECTAYLYEWRNPHPEKKIKMIKAMNVSRSKDQTVTLFGIAAIH